MRPKRNYENVRFAEVRQQIDPLFSELADELDEAYYGQRDERGKFTAGTGWRDGVDVTWMGVRPYKPHEPEPGETPPPPLSQAEAKALFDQCTGMVWHLHLLILHSESGKRAEPYDRNRYDYVRGPEGQIVGSHVQDARDWLKSFRGVAPDLFGQMVAWCSSNGFDLNVDATD